ncbi:peptidoglycan DD-metalloendopeptidase family protein [Massilia oculi]|uniref:Peptidase M23 n=1 Tax=Massilia oculi TaxID=945844 RepID=A0A2S2DMQ4_9BURK|nr:peptidoglycan DD-metalloendopeptidase family protein [Massilia oculi]AWL06652.1 peptidase M23 [Massilia oculi]
MTQAPRLALLTILIGLVAGCSTTTRQAPVVERPVTAAPVRPAPTKVEETPKQDERGMYTVRKGDTLLRIALDFGENYRDLVAWNNLANPDDIKVGQVLRVSQPGGERTANVQTQPVPMPPSASVPRKTEPRADKTPYNEGKVATTTPPATTQPATPAAPAVPAAGDEARLSWMWPSEGRVIATFDDGRNKGIDIAGKMGQPVVAAGSGKVMYAGSGIRGYGNLVIVKHSNSLLSAYAHNRKIVVKEGDNVSRGQVIAEMGDSDADAVKLHFEIRQQGKPVDPTRFLPVR